MSPRVLALGALLAGCAGEPVLYDPAAGDWPGLAVRDVDPLLGGDPLPANALRALRVGDAKSGVRVVARTKEDLDLRVTQPIDWLDPDAGTFEQRVVVMTHLVEAVGPDTPVVLHTQGYDIDGAYVFPALAEQEPAVVLGAVEVDVEHRFFGTSWPAVDSLDTLTGAQEAADLHRVVALLRDALPGPWVSTGASKGGETALSYRFFFPDDVDGTIAYVAPLMEGRDDPRADAWFDQIGDPGCHRAIAAWQYSYLRHADAIVDHYEALGRVSDRAAAHRALLDGLLSSEWSYWQYRSYYGDEACIAWTPAADEEAAIRDMEAVFRVLDPPEGDLSALYSRTSFEHQSLAEQGYPTRASRNLDVSAVAPHLELETSLFEPPDFDGNLQRHLAWWVAHEAHDVVAIYGGWDPWTFGAIEPSDGAEVFVAPEGDHGSGIFDLEAEDGVKVLARLDAWAGLAAGEGGGDPFARAASRARAGREGLRPLWVRAVVGPTGAVVVGP